MFLKITLQNHAPKTPLMAKMCLGAQHSKLHHCNTFLKETNKNDSTVLQILIKKRINTAINMVLYLENT